MFKPKPVYTTDDLNAAVTRIERLTALMDKAESMYRLTKQDQYKASYERLVRNVESSQLYYQRIMEKLNK